MDLPTLPANITASMEKLIRTIQKLNGLTEVMHDDYASLRSLLEDLATELMTGINEVQKYFDKFTTK